LKITPTNTRPERLVRDVSSQLASATLLAQKIRELSATSKLQIDQSMLSMLLSDPSRVSELVRGLGLSDAISKTLLAATENQFQKSVHRKLDPQLANLIATKIHAAGEYDISTDKTDWTDARFEPEPNAELRNQEHKLNELNVAHPFSPTKLDHENSIDDLNSVLRKTAKDGEQNYDGHNFVLGQNNVVPSIQFYQSIWGGFLLCFMVFVTAFWALSR
jgi:hypothetical protein